MSESIQRSRRSGCGSEWSGRKGTSPASGAAEPCRHLARQRSASGGSVKPARLIKFGSLVSDKSGAAGAGLFINGKP